MSGIPQGCLSNSRVRVHPLLVILLLLLLALEVLELLAGVLEGRGALAHRLKLVDVALDGLGERAAGLGGRGGVGH